MKISLQLCLLAMLGLLLAALPFPAALRPLQPRWLPLRYRANPFYHAACVRR
jgi:hypothetical protein